MFIVEGKLNRKSFIDLSKQIETDILNNKIIDDVAIDLNRITFAEPFGIIGLIIFTRHIYNNYNLKSKILLPEKAEVKSYLLSAGIAIDEGIVTNFCGIDYNMKFINWFNSIYIFQNNKNKINFIPITLINNADDINIINDKVDSWMIQNNYSDEERYDIQVLISELCQNINQHSKTIQKGIFLMQGYTRIKDKMKCCIISIGDTGIGIKNSLLQNPNYKDIPLDDLRAINYVFNKGWSSEANEFRGNGFSNLRRLSWKYKLNVFIHSHGGILGYIYPEITSTHRVKITHSINPICGTHVSFELRSKIN